MGSDLLGTRPGAGAAADVVAALAVAPRASVVWPTPRLTSCSIRPHLRISSRLDGQCRPSTETKGRAAASRATSSSTPSFATFSNGSNPVSRRQRASRGESSRPDQSIANCTEPHLGAAFLGRARSWRTRRRALRRSAGGAPQAVGPPQLAGGLVPPPGQPYVSSPGRCSGDGRPGIARSASYLTTCSR